MLIPIKRVLTNYKHVALSYGQNLEATETKLTGGEMENFAFATE